MERTPVPRPSRPFSSLEPGRPTGLSVLWRCLPQACAWGYGCATPPAFACWLRRARRGSFSVIAPEGRYTRSHGRKPVEPQCRKTIKPRRGDTIRLRLTPMRTFGAGSSLLDRIGGVFWIGAPSSRGNRRRVRPAPRTSEALPQTGRDAACNQARGLERCARQERPASTQVL